MQTFALTDVGKSRHTNQDYLYASSDPVGALPNLFLVADGMGGHQAGDFASRFTVEYLSACLKLTKERSVIGLLKEGIEAVNEKLLRKSVENAVLHGMGTTLVAAVIEDDVLYIANVGDSRLYLIREHEIRQITKDHSYVEEMISIGKMTRGSQEYLNKKNLITRAIGAGNEVHIDFFEQNLHSGDFILMCSDGLTNMISDEAIRAIVSSEMRLKDKAEALIAAANDSGGMDNIAVVVIDPQISEVIRC